MTEHDALHWSKAFPELPIRTGKIIDFIATLRYLLEEGSKAFFRETRHYVWQPVTPLFDRYQGQLVRGSCIKFFEPEYFTTLPVVEIQVPIRGKQITRHYATEYRRQMDSGERIKLLGSPLVNRFIRNWHVKDMSQIRHQEDMWELQLPINLSPDLREETEDVFNSFGMYYDTDYNSKEKPWSIGAY